MREPNNTISDNNSLYNEALSLIQIEEYEEAILKLKKLLKEKSEYFSKVDIYNYLGFTHRKLKDYKNAEKYYSKSLQLEPNHLGALEYIGELYLETGRLNKALEMLDNLKNNAGEDNKEFKQLLKLINSYSN